MSDILSSKIQELPQKPGCYLFKNEAGVIIYVGKAVRLKSRVQNYFRKNKGGSSWTETLVKHICDVDYIEVSGNLEALILENNLIKKHRPKYNILLKDDKSFVYIQITKEAFPRINVIRRPKKDGNQYFGPYTSAKSIRDMLRFLRTLLPYRTCKMQITENYELKNIDRPTPCLDYHIKRCTAPCDKKDTSEKYRTNIEAIASFLRGNTQEVKSLLYDRMIKKAQNHEFEAAQALKEHYETIEHLEEKQKIEKVSATSQDILGIFTHETKASIALLQVRSGKLIGKETFHMQTQGNTRADILQHFIMSYYTDAINVPKEIFVPTPINEAHDIQNALYDIHNQNIHIQTPKKGEKSELVMLATQNAENAFAEKQARFEKEYIGGRDAVLALQEALNVPNYPKRIECFDISHLGGTHTVGSQVVFIDGIASKKAYRQFNIKSFKPWEIDDFAAMREVMQRRLAKIHEAEHKPDMILIDGGKGQLSAAKEVFDKLGIDYINDIFLISIAKKEEILYTPEKKDGYHLDYTHAGLRLCVALRDEAHRFALTKNRSARSKAAQKSVFDDIPGVGPKIKKQLTQAFGSAGGVRAASIDEIAAITGKKLAETIKQYL